MSSAFTGIEIGKRGLLAHQTALYVTGHNVSNAETEGYSRQKVTLEVFDPLYVPGLTRELTPGQIGQGVQIEKILRARDMLLEDRILSEKNGLSYWQSMSDWIRQVELVHNEPTESSIMHLLDRFWASWQELANNPEETAAREAVRENGIAVSRHINHNYEALKSIRDNIESSIRARVEEINSIAASIAKLNREILRSESSGDNPNDLWDRRDLLVERLSELTDIGIGRSDKDEFTAQGTLYRFQNRVHQRLFLHRGGNRPARFIQSLHLLGGPLRLGKELGALQGLGHLLAHGLNDGHLVRRPTTPILSLDPQTANDLAANLERDSCYRPFGTLIT